MEIEEDVWDYTLSPEYITWFSRVIVEASTMYSLSRGPMKSLNHRAIFLGLQKVYIPRNFYYHPPLWGMKSSSSKQWGTLGQDIQYGSTSNSEGPWSGSYDPFEKALANPLNTSYRSARASSSIVCSLLKSLSSIRIVGGANVGRGSSVSGSYQIPKEATRGRIRELFWSSFSLVPFLELCFFFLGFGSEDPSFTRLISRHVFGEYQDPGPQSRLMIS